jgi:exonuclease III
VTLRVATGNVNSLDVRLPRLPDWLGANAPDIVRLRASVSNRPITHRWSPT